MAAVDSNVLLRLLVADDEAQQRASESFVSAHAPVWVSHIVLVEVVWGLTSTYRYPKRRVLAALERLLAFDLVIVQDAALIARALDLYRTGNADFSDCVVLELARRENRLPLGAFDKRLGRLDGTRRLGGRAR